MTLKPASLIAFAVPPVDKSSTLSDASTDAISIKPVLSDTLNNARVTGCRLMIAPATLERMWAIMNAVCRTTATNAIDLCWADREKNWINGVSYFCITLYFSISWLIIDINWILHQRFNGWSGIGSIEARRSKVPDHFQKRCKRANYSFQNHTEI